VTSVRRRNKVECDEVWGNPPLRGRPRKDPGRCGCRVQDTVTLAWGDLVYGYRRSRAVAAPGGRHQASGTAGRLGLSGSTIATFTPRLMCGLYIRGFSILQLSVHRPTSRSSLIIWN